MYALALSLFFLAALGCVVHFNFCCKLYELRLKKTKEKKENERERERTSNSLKSFQMHFNIYMKERERETRAWHEKQNSTKLSSSIVS